MGYSNKFISKSFSSKSSLAYIILISYVSIFLAISILSCGFLAIIPVVISVIQGILILTKDIDYLLITFVNNDKKLPLF